jgi:hypothetical protein
MSANGSWTVVGGTSAASPFTAALVAVARAVAKGAVSGRLTPDIYLARASACNDITTGSNGDPAVAGWDPATGLGSPAGDAFIAAITGAAAPTQPAPASGAPPVDMGPGGGSDPLGPVT